MTVEQHCTIGKFLQEVGFRPLVEGKELSEFCALPLDFVPKTSPHKQVHMTILISLETLSKPEYLKEEILKLLKEAFDLGHAEGYEEGYQDS